MKQNTNTRSLNKLFLFICIYKAILDYLYVNYISTSYAFYHFLSNFSILWYPFSWIIVIIFYFWIVKLIKKIGTKFSILLTFSLYLTSIIPFSSMLYGGYDTKYILSNCVFWITWFACLTVFSRFNKRGLIIQTTNKSNNKIIIITFATVSILVILYVSAVYTKFRFSLDMDQAYNFRIEASEDAYVSTIIAYLYQWARIIIPTFLCFSIIKKKYYLSVLFFVVQFFNFGYDGMRLTVLITIIAIVVPLVFRNRAIIHSNIYNFLAISLIGLMLLSIVEHLLFNTGEIDRIITFRTFFLPNLIGSWFFDFFSNNNPEYFRASLLKFFGFMSPYAEFGIDYLISGLYFGEYTARANNGLIADAMANLGKIGLVIMPFIMNFWLHIIDRVSKNIEFPLILLLAIYFAYCFTNNFLSIILFTNGGFITTILLYVIDRYTVDSKNKIVVSRNLRALIKI